MRRGAAHESKAEPSGHEANESGAHAPSRTARALIASRRRPRAAAIHMPLAVYGYPPRRYAAFGIAAGRTGNLCNGIALANRRYVFLVDRRAKASQYFAIGGVGPMVELLKRSVAGLEPPICPHCDVKMVWYRSIRASADSDDIVHYFQCANCDRIGEIKSNLSEQGNGQAPPPKSAKACRPWPVFVRPDFRAPPVPPAG